MKRLGLRFPTWSRLLFSTSFLISFITGALWFYLDGWAEVEGEFGPERHPWIATLTPMHGGAAFLALLCFGMIFSSHLPVAWRTRQSRASGTVLVASVVLLILTAWGLYYAGSDEARQTILWAHLAAALALPFTLFLHLRCSRRAAHR